METIQVRGYERKQKLEEEEETEEIHVDTDIELQWETAKRIANAIMRQEHGERFRLVGWWDNADGDHEGKEKGDVEILVNGEYWFYYKLY